MSQSDDTRRLYAWMRSHPLFDPELPMRRLQALGRRIWDAERPGRTLPVIVAGRGTRHCGVWVSYCHTPVYMGEYRIVLARGERTAGVLVHELTHALGFPTHSRRFVKRYFGLLHRYLGWPLGSTLKGRA